MLMGIEKINIEQIHKLLPKHRYKVASRRREDISETSNRIMVLAYLSPAIIEAVLDGRHPAHLMMRDLMDRFPLDQEEQHRHFFDRNL